MPAAEVQAAVQGLLHSVGTGGLEKGAGLSRLVTRIVAEGMAGAEDGDITGRYICAEAKVMNGSEWVELL